MPEYSLPGKPKFFATACPFHGIAQPILVESHGGRPTRIEGNPDHPFSTNACAAITQATIWDLYNPGRAQAITRAGSLQSEAAFVTALRNSLSLQESSGGAGIHIVIEPTSSPTMLRQISTIQEKYPKATWHIYAPFNGRNTRSGLDEAFGRPLQARYDLSVADVVVSFDDNFLLTSPASVQYASDFADGRRAREDTTTMNRLYVAEPIPSITGATADYRLSANRGRIGHLIKALAARLGVYEEIVNQQSINLTENERKWLDRVAQDLRKTEGSGLIAIGDLLSPKLHILGQAINAKLGALNKTIEFTEPVVPDLKNLESHASLSSLVDALEAGDVGLLLILGANPIYNAPEAARLRELIPKADMTVRQSLFVDETAAVCDWHIPMSHYLEAWSDLRSIDGHASIVQPLIHPLYRSKSLHEMLHLLIEGQRGDALGLVKQTWSGSIGGNSFDSTWRKAVHDGFFEDSAFDLIAVTFDSAAVRNAFVDDIHSNDNEIEMNGLLIEVYPSTTIDDGKFANNPWLQELPDSITKLTWGNAALFSPTTAKQFEYEGGDIRISSGESTIEIPGYLVPGMADGVIGIAAGYGRELPNQIGSNIGVNVYPLRKELDNWSLPVESVTPTGTHSVLAATQTHHSMEGREPIHTLTLNELIQRANDGSNIDSQVKKNEHGDIELSLYPEPSPRLKGDNAWGMMIDLNACIGCNSCTIACQAENNIATVGKEEVIRGREMHWIRVDRYFSGEPEEPEIAFQPVPCMHCENAPCEVVCPVNATVHSNDGLNDMVYNRCVGTRYCSNNCPYKVRRFNYLHYADEETESLKLMRNPDVTVRWRGVMEKCTYCVQRISHTRIQAKIEHRDIMDGDILTACQTACPTSAIVFGDLNDPDSEVSKVRAQPHSYALLKELNTRPRTHYLARVRHEHKKEEPNS